MNEPLKDVLNLIKEHRLKEALVQISAIAAEGNDWMLRNEIEELRTSYDLMLQYALRGMKDPTQHEMYNKLECKTYELAERACLSAELIQPTTKYHFMALDLQRVPPRHFSEIQLQLEAYTEDMGTASLLYLPGERLEEKMRTIRNQHEEALNELFNKVWTATCWTEADAIGAQKIYESLLVPVNDLCVLVSAVTMSLLKLFDIRKYLFLLEAYQHEDPQVNQRALVGIALVSIRYHERIMMYPQARYQLMELNDSPQFCKELLHVQILLLISKETERLEKTMQDEIIPAMIKESKKTDWKKKWEELDSLEEFNPEWNEENHSELDEKIKAMGAWQMAGADLQMSSFAHLKHFPFFRRTSHWFYPFDKQQPDIAKFTTFAEKNTPKGLFQTMLNSGAFCDSDKYSFCLMFSSLPANRQEQLVVNMNDNNDFTDEEKAKLYKSSETAVSKKDICRNYIHDLYRYFKLGNKIAKKEDIFLNELTLWNQEDIGTAICQPDGLRRIANYLFQQRYMDQAFELYQKMIDQNTTDAELWQRAGFCLQKRKDYGQAMKYYRQADLLSPGSKWTLTHLAQCCHHIGKKEEALTYYQEIAVLDPDSLNTIFMLALCLVDLKRYDEALPLFYKVEYLDPHPEKAKKAIGWCLFQSKKYTEAIKIYEQLLASPEANLEDWLNAAHAYLLAGDYAKSVHCYRTIHEQCKSHDEFRNMVLKDMDSLKAQGLNEEDIFILMDGIL